MKARQIKALNEKINFLGAIASKASEEENYSACQTALDQQDEAIGKLLKLIYS
jgi:hypothetical protein